MGTQGVLLEVVQMANEILLSGRLCYIWQHEWNILTQNYPYDHVITVTKNVTEDGVRQLATCPGES